MFKVYVSIMLLLIVLLLATLVAGLDYAGRHATTQLTNTENHIDKLNQNLNSINASLNNVDSQLKKDSSLPSGL